MSQPQTRKVVKGGERIGHARNHTSVEQGDTRVAKVDGAFDMVLQARVWVLLFQAARMIAA
jgi:hypothetical protein